jgi:NAD+ kinase
MKFAIFSNQLKDVNLELTKRVIGNIESLKCEYFIKPNEDGLTDQFSQLTEENIDDCDIALVIGGDGTILRAKRYFGTHDIALLGINLGKVGFMSDVGIRDIDLRLNQLIDGEYRIEPRMMVRLSDEQDVIGDALNEIALKNDWGMGVGDFKVYSDETLVGHYSADGILVVSPTGSTAYALSAGGPIVNPACNVMIIQPLSPHSLNNRSIVINATEKVTLEFDPESTKVCVDGEIINMIETRILSVAASPKQAKFVKFSDYNFYKMLFEKIKEPNYLRGGLS